MAMASSRQIPQVLVQARWRRLSVILCSFFLGLLISAAAYFAGGAGLSFYFGTFLMGSIVCPFLAQEQPDLPASRYWSFACCAALWSGISLAWLTTLNQPGVLLFDLIRCAIILGTYMLALAGATQALTCIGPCCMPALVAAASLAWLTWPIWLSAVLSGPHGATLAAFLVPIDPLMAVNSVLKIFAPGITPIQSHTTI